MSDDDNVRLWVPGTGTEHAPRTGNEWSGTKVVYRGKLLTATGRCVGCQGFSVGFFEPPNAEDAGVMTLVELCEKCGKDHRLFAGDLKRIPAMPGHFEEQVVEPDYRNDPNAGTIQSQSLRKQLGTSRGRERLAKKMLAGAQRGICGFLGAGSTKAGVLGDLAGDGMFAGMSDVEPLHPDDVDEEGRFTEESKARMKVREPYVPPDYPSNEEMTWVRINDGYETEVYDRDLCWGRIKCLRDDGHDGDCLPAETVTVPDALERGWSVRKA